MTDFCDILPTPVFYDGDPKGLAVAVCLHEGRYQALTDDGGLLTGRRMLWYRSPTEQRIDMEPWW